MFMNSVSKFFRILFTWLTVIAGVFCLTLSASVAAKEARPCAEDAARLCKGVEPGEGRVAKCMKEHEKELSPACRKNIAELKEDVKEFAEACKEDIQKDCKDVKPGGGRILHCLKQHEASLSPSCREKMPQSKGKK